MATSPVPVLVQKPSRGLLQLQNGTLSGTLYTGGSNGTKITGLLITSTDTSAQTVTVNIVNGGISYPLCTISIPIGAGTVAGTPAINVMSSANMPGLPVDATGTPYFFLASASDTITMTAGAITAGKYIYGISVAGDF